MSDRCNDIDPFIDGELAPDQAGAFRDHIATCERCQAVLHGRMQELAALDRIDAPIVMIPPTPPSTRPPPKQQRRWPMYAGTALAAAAAAAVALWPEAPAQQPLSVALEITSSPTMRGGSGVTGAPSRALAVRGATAHVGQYLKFKAQGGRHRQIWVYLDNAIVTACPGEATCHDLDDQLVLEYQFAHRGTYEVLAFSADEKMEPPHPTFEGARGQLAGAGIAVEQKQIRVN